MQVRDLAARCARVVQKASPSDKEGAGNAGCPLHPQPRVQSVESTRVRHHRFTGTPGISCAMVLTACFVLSSVTGLVCHRRLQIWRPATRLGVRHLRKLDAVGASGPHDFAVRVSAVRLRAVFRSRAQRTALRPLCVPTLPRPPRPAPRS
jgi:hypothetical protein